MVDNENAKFDYERPIGKITIFGYLGGTSNGNDWRAVIDVISIMLR